MMKLQMPKIDLSLTDLEGRDLEIAERCLKGDGLLRSVKPKGDGEAAYVWRLVCFSISPHPRHQYMPVCADFDLPQDPYWMPGNSTIRRARTEELDVIANKMIDVVPRKRWSGVSQWTQAVGIKEL